MKKEKKCARHCGNSADAQTVVSGLNNLTLSQKILLGVTLGLIAILAANVIVDGWLGLMRWLVINVGGNPYGW